MDKLIELLDQYRKQNTKEFFGDDGSLVVLTGKDFIELNRLIIISKEYEFIKRLVENDKIDLLQIDNRIALSEFNKVERVLMALSISDTPIEDLISYLK